MRQRGHGLGRGGGSDIGGAIVVVGRGPSTQKKLSQGVTSRHQINSRRHENADFRDERMLGSQN